MFAISWYTVSLLFFHCITIDPIVAKQGKQPNQFQATTQYGDFEIEVQSPVIYVPKDGKTSIRNFVGVALSSNGVPIKEIGGFFDTKPKPTKIRIGESKDYEKRTYGETSQLTFAKLGQINIVMDIGDHQVLVPIEVKEVPFAVGMDSDLLVTSLGLPQSNKHYFVKWPENRTIEEIFYTIEARESIYKVEHWKFNSLPNCIFSIRDTKIYGIHSVFVDPTDRNRFPDAYMEKQIENRKRELKNKIEEDEKEEEPDPRLEEFMLKNGMVLRARFVDYRKSMFILERFDGVEMEFSAAEFDSKSAARLRELFKKMPKESERKKKK